MGGQGRGVNVGEYGEECGGELWGGVWEECGEECGRSREVDVVYDDAESFFVVVVLDLKMTSGRPLG